MSSCRITAESEGRPLCVTCNSAFEGRVGFIRPTCSFSSTSEIAAHGGWDNLKQVEHCTKSVRRQKLIENVVSRRQNRAEKE